MRSCLPVSLIEPNHVALQVIVGCVVCFPGLTFKKTKQNVNTDVFNMQRWLCCFSTSVTEDQVEWKHLVTFSHYVFAPGQHPLKSKNTSAIFAGQSKFSEAGVWETGRAETVGDASCGGAADHPRGREVAADVRVPVPDLGQPGAGSHLWLHPEGLQLCQHGVHGHQLDKRADHVPNATQHHPAAGALTLQHVSMTTGCTHKCTHTDTHTHTHKNIHVHVLTPSPSDWSFHDALHWNQLFEETEDLTYGLHTDKNKEHTKKSQKNEFHEFWKLLPPPLCFSSEVIWLADLADHCHSFWGFFLFHIFFLYRKVDRDCSVTWLAAAKWLTVGELKLTNGELGRWGAASPVWGCGDQWETGSLCFCEWCWQPIRADGWRQVGGVLLYSFFVYSDSIDPPSVPSHPQTKGRGKLIGTGPPWPRLTGPCWCGCFHGNTVCDTVSIFRSVFCPGKPDSAGPD